MRHLPPTDRLPTSPEEIARMLASLRAMAARASSDAEVRMVTSRIAQITRAYRVANGIGIPTTLIEQAHELDAGFVARPHISYLSDRIGAAVRDVERGRNRQIAVSLPPRSGKSTLISLHGPTWMLRRHPEWEIMTASYDGALSASWARSIRWTIEDHPDLGIALARDGGAGSHWKTVEGGGMTAVSVRGALTGRGARVMIIDDPVKDFVEAHSPAARQSLWDWWLSVAQTRLEPPYLVVVVMTRWHEDDFVGRLFSKEHEGDPRDWERISIPALAEADDAIGREPGEPLLSPLLTESPSQAVTRWGDVKRAVGTYTFSAMYQQRPAPQKGAIFDSGWWRFWTSDPGKATADGRVVHLDPSSLTTGRWLDSWDCAFKGKDDSDWVVGQRWVRHQANRYLVAQKRGRWSFTQTLDHMERWASPGSPYGNLVHQRLIEDKANGPAIIDTLQDKIAGLKAINPKTSKEARARSVTPEIESGNVYLPHPTDPGNEWVSDLLSELRNFPYDANDDQVDALTQALADMRDAGKGLLTVPGRAQQGVERWNQPRDVTATARTMRRRSG
jgi:predicted phage terminase large subunit-like protein